MIHLASVTKRFQSGRGEVAALTDVSFEVDTGCFSAVIGKSGSGKSTLLNCIGGLEPPDTGTIACLGQSLYRLSEQDLSLFQRQYMGFVFQRGNLLSYLTVSENIGFPLTLNNIVGSQQQNRIDELLERIGLPTAGNALPHELSGGETQRVAVARAIAHFPKILLADEPTANLDTETGQKVVRLMRQMGRDYGCTIVMATHDTEITTAAEMIIRLRDGRMETEEA